MGRVQIVNRRSGNRTGSRVAIRRRFEIVFVSGDRRGLRRRGRNESGLSAHVVALLPHDGLLFAAHGRTAVRLLRGGRVRPEIAALGRLVNLT